jgi:hypothetical protein
MLRPRTALILAPQPIEREAFSNRRLAAKHMAAEQQAERDADR